MAIRWSCFLSFRGGKGNLASGILDLFTEALANELDLQVDAGLYRYTDEMVAGDIIDPTIADELLASACMIILFTGKYFSKKQSYCAREYLMMSQLERARLNQLSTEIKPKKGLIVPVILRNPDRFPPMLKTRFWVDFTGFAEDDTGIAKPKKFFNEIRKIADYIAARYYELDGVISEEEALELPDDKTVNEFLIEVQSSLTKAQMPKR